jgi:hypothetical protein
MTRHIDQEYRKKETKVIRPNPGDVRKQESEIQNQIEDEETNMHTLIRDRARSGQSTVTCASNVH